MPTRTLESAIVGFDGDTCCVCGGTFDWGGDERKINHATWHDPSAATSDRVPDPVADAADEHMRALVIEPLAGTPRPIGPPNAVKLERHVKLYGSEGVIEAVRPFSADTLPLSMYRTDAPRGRRMTSETRRLILDYGSTHPPSAIAGTLNLSERRVKEVLAAGSREGVEPPEMASTIPVSKPQI